MTIAPDGRVIETRPIIALGDLKIGKPVRSLTMSQLANLAMWVRGRGRCLVPQHACKTRLAASGSTVQHYKVKPSGPAIARVWIGEVRLILGSGYYGHEYSVQAGSGPTQTGYAGAGSGDANTFVYIETPAAKTSSATDLQFTFTGSTTSTMELVSLACWELPRIALARLSASADDLGLALDSYGPRRPFYEQNDEGPLALATVAAQLSTKRGTLFADWCDLGIVTTSGTFVDCYEFPVPIVPSKDKPGDTTRTCTFDVWGHVSAGGTTGEVRAKSAIATSAAVTLNSTTYGWRGTVTLDVQCEDPATVDGMPGGVADTIQVQIRRTGGAGDVVWKGVVLYE